MNEPPIIALLVVLVVRSHPLYPSVVLLALPLLSQRNCLVEMAMLQVPLGLWVCDSWLLYDLLTTKTITLHPSRLAHDPSNLARHNYSSDRFSILSGSDESVLAPLEGARQISSGGLHPYCIPLHSCHSGRYPRISPPLDICPSSENTFIDLWPKLVSLHL